MRSKQLLKGSSFRLVLSKDSSSGFQCSFEDVCTGNMILCNCVRFAEEESFRKFSPEPALQLDLSPGSYIFNEIIVGE